MRRVPVANVSQVLIDAKDLLQDDNARTITTGGQDQIGVELTSIKRFHCDHFCSFPPRESFIREVEWIGQLFGVRRQSEAATALWISSLSFCTKRLSVSPPQRTNDNSPAVQRLCQKSASQRQRREM